MQVPGADLLQDVQVEAAITDESKRLKSEDPTALAKCLAALVMLVGQLPQRMPDAFFNKLGRVVELLHNSDLNVKRNASALLAAAAADEDCWKEIVRQEAGRHALQELGAAGEDGVRINSLALLTAVAQGGEPGLQQAMQHGAAAACVAHCSPSHAPRVQEAAADALCQLLAQEELRPALAEAGAVAALCSVLGARDQEVVVRALMGLGMLLPGSEANQAAATQAPGALAHILAQMRQGEDPDCQVIARDLFALLGRNEAAKEAVAAALRGA